MTTRMGDSGAANAAARGAPDPGAATGRPDSAASRPRRVLLLGPAGSGKSRALQELFVREGGTRPEADVLLLVPTASYRDHARNQILRSGPAPAFSGSSICTFDDLLERLAPQSAASGLSAARAELIVRRLLSELDLPSFERVSAFGGFRDEIVEAAEELRVAGLDADTVASAFGRRPSPEQRDFLRFLAAWDAAAIAGGGDERIRRARALDAVRHSRFPLRLLLVDGFSDFTAEQREILTALLSCAAEAHVALTAGPSSDELFYQAERSRAWLERLGFQPQWLDENYRAETPALLAVERALRLGEVEPPPPLFNNQALCLIEAADRRDEVELIGREIARLVRTGACSYRDVGIVVRHPETYAPLFRDVFRRLDMPLREFVPITLASTGVGRHLELCLNLFLPEERPACVIEWMKSPYSPVETRATAENFEYLAMKRLADARAGNWDRVLGDARLYVGGELRKIEALQRRASGPRPVADWRRWAADVWAGLARLPAPGDAVPPSRVLELRAEARAWTRLPSLLDELGEAAAAENTPELDFVRFRELLLSLLRRETIFVRDRRVDAVNLMNIFEARQWELSVVFVPGLVEKEFPVPPREALFVGDSERGRIGNARSVPLPTSVERARDERNLFYVACSRARTRLYLSRPAGDASGRQTLESFFLRDLGVLVRPPVCAVLQRRRSHVVLPAPLAANRADLLAACHAELGARFPDRAAGQLAAALYERLRDGGETRRALLALAPRPVRITLPAALDRIREVATSFSPSSFEMFAECRFKYFAAKLLRLKGAPEPDELDYRTEGSIAHAAIEKWLVGGCARSIDACLEEAFAEQTETIPPGHTRTQAREQLEHSLRVFAENEVARADLYRTSVSPQYVELKFGFDEQAGGGDPVWPPILVTATDGAEIRVRGRLDRVEIAEADGAKLGLVVDYKYSAKGFNAGVWENIENGRSLALPIYLLALQEVFGMTPAGGELYPLKAAIPERSGVYNRALLPVITNGGQIPGHGEALDPEPFAELLKQARIRMSEYAGAVRSGLIAVSQQESERCGQCEFLDLCRMNQWQTEAAQEAANLA